MKGSPCPQCGQQVMTYREFFRKAEPNKVFSCAGCGSELRRSRLVYLLLVACGVPLVVALHFAISAPNYMGAALALVVGVVVWVPVVNLLGYVLPLWRVKQ